MLTRAQTEKLAHSLHEPPEITAVRMAAYDRLAERALDGVPERVDTGVAAAFSVPESAGPDRDRVTFAVGGELRRGAIDASVAAALLKAHVSLLPADDDPALLLHHAFRTQTFFVHVPDGAHLRAPTLLALTSAAPWTASHVVCVLGRGARMTLVEDLQSDRGGIDREPDGTAVGAWSHGVEVVLGEGATLTWISLQGLDAGVRACLFQRASLGANASVRWVNVTAGAGELTQDLVNLCDGADAAAAIDWAFLVRGAERIRLSAANRFLAPRGGGQITMRGVAEERASAACHGMIEIGPKGSGTSTHLTQEMLMLDPTARVDAVPALRIETNDVKASHSATVARVTHEDLFYFASRGIPESAAKAMFIGGFLGDIADRIDDADARGRVHELLRAKRRA